MIYAATLASSLKAVKSSAIHILYSGTPDTFRLYPTLSGQIDGCQNKTATRYRPTKSSSLTPLHFNLSHTVPPAASARTSLSWNCAQSHVLSSRDLISSPRRVLEWSLGKKGLRITLWPSGQLCPLLWRFADDF